MRITPGFDLAKLDPDVRARLLAAVTPAQIRLLGRVLVDAETQHQIAKKTKAPRSTVQSRIHAACARIRERIGIDIPLPRRGRPRKLSDLTILDPSEMEGLTTDTDADGIHHGRWQRSRDRSEESRDE